MSGQRVTYWISERPTLRPMVNGYELWHIQCNGCGRETTREGGNELVGTQARLRCMVCGHRGAELRRVWHVGKKKPGTKPG